MIEILIVFDEEAQKWLLYHQDIDDQLAKSNNLASICRYAYDIAKLIKPSTIYIIPRQGSNKVKIAEYY